MPIRTAVLGAGAFARYIHLPNLRKDSAFDLRAVVDVNSKVAEGAAETFGAGYATTEYDRMLKDRDIELVVICTPHNLHASHTLRAISAGKHVLTEKPMCLTLDDAASIVKAARESGLIVSVGLNRRYAPLTQKARELLAGRTGPLVMNYRVMDQLWRHPWALDPLVGGGRVLSEAVHMFDFCAYLIGSEPRMVYAAGGALTHPDAGDTQDNAVMTLQYADGSIASIMIGDLGNSAYPKERIEIFPGEHAILIDNYERLEAVGYGDPIRVELLEIEKGFVQELSMLARAIAGEDTPDLVTAVDGARATLCAVRAIESIKTGVPQRIDLTALV